MGDADYSLAELCITACAEAWRGDGEILASAMGIVPRIAVAIARLTFEPDLLTTDGQAYLLHEPQVVGRRLSLDPAVREGWMPFSKVFDMTWAGQRHVMMGASQVDRFGNTNISCIGDWHRPKRQLLGVRGAPGNSINHACSYWVPSHTLRVFVEDVDMVSGLGYDPARWEGISRAFHDTRCVVTNLCVIDFKGPDNAARLKTIHPNITVDEVLAHTGFDLFVPDDLPVTKAPTPEALSLIRDVIDPHALRVREVAEPKRLEGLAT
jgi:acyl CoA:acetate/3-ketoacid CoA transferase beta subunit